MATQVTLEESRGMAVHAGLTLTDEELQKLLQGVNRARDQVAELRQLVTDATEPAAIFTALKVSKV